MRLWITLYRPVDEDTARLIIFASESGTALAKGLGQMSLVNDYQTFRPNLGSSSVVRDWVETFGNH